MNDRIQNAIIELHELLKKEMGSDVTSCRIFISASSCELESTTHSPAQLKNEGISMRNIRGEFIK